VLQGLNTHSCLAQRCFQLNDLAHILINLLLSLFLNLIERNNLVLTFFQLAHGLLQLMIGGLFFLAQLQVAMSGLVMTLLHILQLAIFFLSACFKLLVETLLQS